MTFDTQSDRIAYWLLPDHQDGRTLQDVIEDLAGRTGSPVFRPHVTLFVTPAGGPPSPDERLIRAAACSRPLALSTAAPPLWSPFYNRALVLPLRSTTELERLVGRLDATGTPSPEAFPHLSLLYGSIARDAADALLETLALPSVFRFDRIAAVRVGPVTRSHEDVRRWEVIAVEDLGNEIGAGAT